MRLSSFESFFLLVTSTLPLSIPAFHPPSFHSQLPSTKTFSRYATRADELPQIRPKQKTAGTVSRTSIGDAPKVAIATSALAQSTNNNSTIINHLARSNQFVEKFLSAGGGDDPIGTRGELYFFLQAFLIVSIAFGSIPVLSRYLSLLAGPGLLAVGIVTLSITAMDMGESITPWPKPNGQGLVQSGLYGIVRHPMYFGLLTTMAGLSIATSSIDRLLLTVLLYSAIETKSEYEEGELRVSQA